MKKRGRVWTETNTIKHLTIPTDLLARAIGHGDWTVDAVEWIGPGEKGVKIALTKWRHRWAPMRKP